MNWWIVSCEGETLAVYGEALADLAETKRQTLQAAYPLATIELTKRSAKKRPHVGAVLSS